jgi:hypothetical protein
VRLHGLVATLVATLVQPLTSIVQAAVVVAQVELVAMQTTRVVLTVVLVVLVVICLHGVANPLELLATVEAAAVLHQGLSEHLARVVLVVAAMVRNRAQAVRQAQQTQVAAEAESDRCQEHWLV